MVQNFVLCRLLTFNFINLDNLLQRPQTVCYLCLMDSPISNAVLSLSPEMIQGLLEDLPQCLGQTDSAAIKGFLDMLTAHPVVRASRGRSLALSAQLPFGPLASEEGTSVAVITEEPSYHSMESSDASDTMTTNNRVTQGNEGQTDVGSGGGEKGRGVSCCRNGIKTVKFNKGRKAAKRGAGDVSGSERSYKVSKRPRRDKRKMQDEEMDEGVHDGGQTEKEDCEDQEGQGGGGMDGNYGAEGDSVDSSQGQSAESSKIKGKREANHRAERSAWRQDGTPPSVDKHTLELIDQLAHLDLNDNLQSLVDLLKRLLHLDLQPSDSEAPPYSLAAVIANCAQMESQVTFYTFQEMIALIRLAFSLQ